MFIAGRRRPACSAPIVAGPPQCTRRGGDTFKPIMTSNQARATSTVCPRCSTAGTGRFCTECGAPINSPPCVSCGQPLTAGSKFCYNCGAAAGAVAGVGTAAGAAAGPVLVAPRVDTGATIAKRLPWAVAGIAFLVLFVVVVNGGLNAKRGSSVDGPANALPNPSVDAGGAAAGAAGAGAGAGVTAASDISNLSPTEIANRLFDRVMRLSEEGKSDSVAFFAPMAAQAYQMMEQAQGHPFDADQRFDVGRIGVVAGARQIAKAEADTILRQQPDHLLGLLLAAQAAKLGGNTAAMTAYKAAFARVKARELAKNLPEYTRHRAEIDAGV